MGRNPILFYYDITNILEEKNMSNFNTKEDYIKFITAWKAAANHEKCKKHIVPCDHYQYRYSGFTEQEQAELALKGYKVNKYYYVVPGGAKCKTTPWLTGSHFILRNALLGKELTRGFHPKGKKKCGKYENPWLAFELSFNYLQWVIDDAQSYIKKNNDEAMQEWIKNGRRGLLRKNERTPDGYTEFLHERYVKRVIEFIEPFNGAVTLNDIAKIDIDELREKLAPMAA